MLFLIFCLIKYPLIFNFTFFLPLSFLWDTLFASAAQMYEGRNCPIGEWGQASRYTEGGRYPIDMQWESSMFSLESLGIQPCGREIGLALLFTFLYLNYTGHFVLN